MEDSLASALALSPAEAKIYSTILQATSILPKSDPRYTIVIGMTWWLVHRRKRMEQQLIRRRQFSRRIRRLVYLRWQLQRNSLQGISSAVRATETAMMEDLACIPDKKLWMKNDQRNATSSGDDFWDKFDQRALSAETFLKNFHMTQETFDLIYKELEEHLKKTNTTMREPLPAKKRLAATLYRLATNAEYLKVAGLFGIGKSTTTSLVRDVCEVIVNILRDKFLDFSPVDEERIKHADKVFQIPGVIGVLGSIDVFIVGSSWDWSSSSPFASVYSRSYAVVFQAVVDHLGCFRHVFAGAPSGLSNLDVLRKSELDLLMEDRLQGGNVCGRETQDFSPILVADESYKSSHSSGSGGGSIFSWILTHSTPAAAEKSGEECRMNELNEKINKSEAIFEEAVTKVKSRWKIFHGKNGKINFNADAFENIALACCILHNICESRGDPIDPSWTSDVHGSLFLRKGSVLPECNANGNVEESHSLELEENDYDEETLDEEMDNESNNEPSSILSLVIQ